MTSDRPVFKFLVPKMPEIWGASLTLSNFKFPQLKVSIVPPHDVGGDV